jgi:hypothetical protein
MGIRLAHRALIGAGLAWVAFAGGADAAQRLWSRPDTPAAIMQAHLEGCTRQAEDTHTGVDTYRIAGPSISIGSAVGAAVVASIEEGRARKGFLSRCMHAAGYVGVLLTSDEQAQVRRAKGSAQAIEWAQRIYDSPGFSDRLRQAVIPPVTPLPPPQDIPMTWRGLRIATSVLKPAEGTLSPGAVALSGVVAHRRTATVKHAFVTPGMLPITLAEGTHLHEVVDASEEDPDQSAWCGVGTFRSIWGVKKRLTCFWTNDDGYVSTFSRGDLWLASNLMDSEYADYYAAGSLDLALDQDDTVGPMDFTVSIAKVGKSGVTLEVKARKDGASVSLWYGEEPYGPDGRAVMPFWDHRLVLTPVAGGVVATFPPDGDGKGWR